MYIKQWMLIILLFAAQGQALAFDFQYRSALDSAPVVGQDNALEESTQFYNLLSKSAYLFVYQTIVIYGLTKVPESWTLWDHQQSEVHNWWNNWKRNIKRGPVWDRDPGWVNYIGHPWSGMGYYMMARRTGYDRFESFLYSTFESTVVWEYGIEAAVEVPSYQDLLLTSTIGSLWGELNYQILENIEAHDGKVGGSKSLGSFVTVMLNPFDSAVIFLRNVVRGGKYYHPKVVSNIMLQPIRELHGIRKQGQQMVLSWSMQF